VTVEEGSDGMYKMRGKFQHNRMKARAEDKMSGLQKAGEH